MSIALAAAFAKHNHGVQRTSASDSVEDSAAQEKAHFKRSKPFSSFAEVRNDLILEEIDSSALAPSLATALVGAAPTSVPQAPQGSTSTRQHLHQSRTTKHHKRSSSGGAATQGEAVPDIMVTVENN
ncbi:hypothetical protein GUJ93_ZPchr0015g6673 [Zizania palustris]|uniref:Uncharacterized protein n=1 Tax=Zizania palustris TaxID=103762 RepID=A0A8J5SYG4_ZIZPA|nr:hypothetical protein GUJ93_ZPchr0015g6673 [Zizania palustris]